MENVHSYGHLITTIMGTLNTPNKGYIRGPETPNIGGVREIQGSRTLISRVVGSPPRKYHFQNRELDFLGWSAVP